MANSDANDPSDVDYEEVDHEEVDYEDSPPASPAPARPRPAPAQAGASRAQPQPPGPFDAKAAKQALRKAAREVGEQCATAEEPLGGYTVRVTFGPNGRAANAELDPAPESVGVVRCAQEAFVRVQVPPFKGGETAVKMSFPERQ